jgi:hypothetical protein
MKAKPLGWMPTKPSPHQIFMLRMFSKGWRFKLHNDRPGSWNTYWSLIRRGLVKPHAERNELTEKGWAALSMYGKDLPTLKREM